MKTSLNDPLQIAEVSSVGAQETIGLTLCPGERDRDGGWNRDLDLDATAIRDWGADVVGSLIETWEPKFLEVTDLPNAAKRHGMRWVHLPIVDVCGPKRRFEARRVAIGPELRGVARRGGRVLVHCRGGLDPAGTIAPRPVVELGTDPDEAIRAVRHARPRAIETCEQKRHVLACRPIIDVTE